METAFVAGDGLVYTALVALALVVRLRETHGKSWVQLVWRISMGFNKLRS